MAIQFSVAVRNAMLDAEETTIGTSAVMKIFTGSAPANCAATDTGTKLAQIQLPSDWMSAAASGVKSLLGTWSETSADATGTAGYYRIYDSGIATCHEQGTVTATGGGGDLTLATATINSADTITITSFSHTAANA